MNRVDDLSDGELIARLTDGFPPDIRFSLNRVAGDGGAKILLLTGVKNDAFVFERHEVFDHTARTTLPGKFNTHAKASGVKGMGLRYMVNLAALLRDMDYSAIRIEAGDKSGGYLWALAGAEMDPEHMHPMATHRVRLHQLMQLADAKDSMTRATHIRLQRAVDAIHDDRRALWAIADNRTVITPSAALRASPHFQRVAAHAPHEPVRVGPYLLLGSVWRGVFDVNDAVQMERLESLAARKFRVLDRAPA